MPESTEDSSLSGFGANEWLVDEMYEKYVQDPNSVDKVWWDFFGRSQQRTELDQPLRRGVSGLEQRVGRHRGEGVDRGPQAPPVRPRRRDQDRAARKDR